MQFAAQKAVHRNLAAQAAAYTGPLVANGRATKPLLFTVQNGSPQALGKLLEGHEAENAANAIFDPSKKFSLLHAVSLFGYAEKTKTLLACGAELDAKSIHGVTALFGAAARGHVVVVRILVEAGAAIDHCLPNGVSAMGIAKLRRHGAVCEYLAQCGAQFTEADIKALDAAAKPPAAQPAQAPALAPAQAQAPAGLAPVPENGTAKCVAHGVARASAADVAAAAAAADAADAATRAAEIAAMKMQKAQEEQMMQQLRNSQANLAAIAAPISAPAVVSKSPVTTPPAAGAPLGMRSPATPQPLPAAIELDDDEFDDDEFSDQPLPTPERATGLSPTSHGYTA
eukprot:SAG11_NODE_116_length_16002_cov_19.164560_24_plen_342_part_00